MLPLEFKSRSSFRLLTAYRVFYGLLRFLDAQSELLYLWTQPLSSVVKHQRKFKFPHVVQSLCLLAQSLKVRDEINARWLLSYSQQA